MMQNRCCLYIENQIFSARFYAKSVRNTFLLTDMLFCGYALDRARAKGDQVAGLVRSRRVLAEPLTKILACITMINIKRGLVTKLRHNTEGLKLHVTWVYEMGQSDLIYSKPFAMFYSIDMPRITTKNCSINDTLCLCQPILDPIGLNKEI